MNDYIMQKVYVCICVRMSLFLIALFRHKTHQIHNTPTPKLIQSSYSQVATKNICHQDGPRYQQSNYSTLPAAQAQKRAPLKPLDVSSPGASSPLATPNLNQSPQGFKSPTPAKGWAPVHSPTQTPPPWRQSSQPTYPGQQYQQTVVQQNQQYQHQQPYEQSYQKTQQYQYSQQYQTTSQQQYQSPQYVQSANVYSPSKQQTQSQYTPTTPNPTATVYQV